ncbi:MAG: hypothetical protein WC809_14075 [Sinimarinibacterium sp.]|jgi:hypothetical protein
MQLSEHQYNEPALRQFGEEATTLLLAGRFDDLANRFGYAIANGREPAKAIEDDFTGALSGSGVDEARKAKHAVFVKHFKQNDTKLLALVESRITLSADKTLLVELIVAAAPEGKRLYLEQISGV